MIDHRNISQGNIMAIDTVEVRICIPQDLNVILQVLAEEESVTKVSIAKDIICSFLEKHLVRHKKLHAGLKEIGMQSELLDRRGFPGGTL